MVKWIAERRLNVIDGSCLVSIGALGADERYGNAFIVFVVGMVVSLAVEYWSERNA